MRDLLVGSTGFVGQNLLASHAFYAACHSTDIDSAFGSAPDLCVYAGVPSAMYVANADPAADLAVMETARQNLRRIRAKEIVLISTIAVWQDSRGMDEDDMPSVAGLSAYGRNRLTLENWVREDFDRVTVLRLPALFGTGLKKNFLYDLHTLIPQLLKAEKYRALSEHSALVRGAYAVREDGFYVRQPRADRAALYAFFKAHTFNALSFTDSRSRYQFYPLRRLWQDITFARTNQITLLHAATPPIAAKDVYRAVRGNDAWTNEIEGIAPYDYDLRTKYSEALVGTAGYMMDVDEEMREICDFMGAWKDEA